MILLSQWQVNEQKEEWGYEYQINTGRFLRLRVYTWHGFIGKWAN